MSLLYTNFRWWESGEPQSMRVEDGRVTARGADVRGEAAQTQDLGGKILAPAFIDAHCHILPTGLDLQKLNLAPFDTGDQVLDAVRDRHQIEPEGKWLRAVLYDQTRFPDGQHLHRSQLDAISLCRPIVLRHVNGHASVANTAALRAAGVDEDVQDPPGGTFCRDESGRLTGVLLEHAHERVHDSGPKLTLDEMVEAILAAGEKMAELGIRCASDMMTGRYDLDLELQAYRIAAERGCRVRTRLYLQFGTVFSARGIDPARLAELSNAMDPEQTRVAGIKIFADGAIGSRTAAIYGAYEGDPSAETPGTLIYAPDKLKQMVRTAHDAGYQVSVHSIGNRATDCVMDAFAGTDEPSRHRIEHAMILSDAQIERLASLGCFVTMQPEFLMRIGHAYQRNLGPERTAKLKRARSVIDAGLRLSFNSDRPIVAGDPRDGIRTAVRRPEGFDPAESVSFAEAMKAYSVEGARVNGDAGKMGSLAVGELADFQLFDNFDWASPS